MGKPIIIIIIWYDIKTIAEREFKIYMYPDEFCWNSDEEKWTKLKFFEHSIFIYWGKFISMSLSHKPLMEKKRGDWWEEWL